MTQIDQIIDEFLERRARGEEVSADRLIREHADLMPQLGEVLRRVQLLDRARQSAGDTLDLHPDQSASTAQPFPVRCPHCQQINQAGNVHDVIDCQSCQQRFRLLDSREIWDLPEDLGRFELLCCIGLGGFGSVWKARDRQLDRLVAIKRPRQSRLDKTRLADFLQEARIAARLKHPHIVDVYEVGTEDDDVFIVSDFIDGRSLADWKIQHPFSPLEAARLLEQIARALQHAHEHNVVHRDLKPGNILIDHDGEPHVTDFGLAKLDVEDVTVTLDGRVLGTPAYMSPEQARGHSSEADARSDVFSLGVVLYELVTGEVPFRGQTAMLVYQVIHDEPTRPRKLNAYIPLDLETVVLKCLEKDPARRYQTAGKLADELKRVVAGEPIYARPISRAQRSWRWCGRNPYISSFAASTIVLLLLLVAAGWWAFLDEARDSTELQAALTDLQQTHGDLRSTHDELQTAHGQLEAALRQETWIRQAYLQSDDFHRFQRRLETTVVDDEFLDEIRMAWADSVLTRLRTQLGDPTTADDPALAQPLIEQLTHHPARVRLQAWLADYGQRADVPVFAWFILDEAGLQLARSPADRASGRNYAWRTYFHGGPRDFRNHVDYLKSAPAHERHVDATFLSAALFTDVTHEYVVVVSTPIVDQGRFQGVLGVMVQLNLPESEPREVR